MSNKLNNYANASAGRKEDRIFAVSSMVQSSKNRYAIQDVVQRSGVELETVYSYLLTILKANALDMRYLGRLRKPFEETWLAKNGMDNFSVVLGKDEYDKWQEVANEAQTLTDAQKESLKGYIFDESRVISREQRYDKLEGLLLQAKVWQISKNASEGVRSC